ncbi:ABC transporter permease [Mucilaginibacter sp. UR6-1]|uniref:ABC transporter permease n=1 Tax=Mucilaginibacter sp. UR6-1 TaxID=1435643 RepID=UPI001E5BFB21|nr:FtsX-like permease family protein [Mucilaginibacter sp. UR6-1]MCC8411252.1 ABC transporter permease [Mucilaginibacter sp. UR6-1]
MFKHLFKLIWNKKKQNFLLITEILVSFMVIFAVFTLIVNYYQNYRQPMGLDYERVWVINYQNRVEIKDRDSLKTYYDNLLRKISSMPYVQEASFASSNVPFSANTHMNGVDYKKIHVNSVNYYEAGDTYHKVLNMQVTEGRWFSRVDDAGKVKPIVINNSLRKELFGTGKAIGEQTGGKDSKRVVVGVVEDVKAKGDYQKAGTAMYERVDTSASGGRGRILLKVAPSADAAFESRVYKVMANDPMNSGIEIEHLADKRVSINKTTLVPMIILLIIAGFLVVNVALGLFGVLWYNISKRKGEIGLRRAVGASGASVSGQLVAESMILATLALIVGAFFAVQFPILNVFDLRASVYIIAILLSVMFIYLLVLVCALYPGRQAAAIYPAVALHEE